jgi:hypothetical protein
LPPRSSASFAGRGNRTTANKLSLDLFWLRDESLEDSANLPDPNLLAQEIADELRSALGQIEEILGDLERRAAPVEDEPGRSRQVNGQAAQGGHGNAD